METKETGGPAFPVECDWSGEEPHSIQTGNQQGYATGLTMRDYFAAKAMQGFTVAFPDWTHDETAKAAYGQADAMLEARAK